MKRIKYHRYGGPEVLQFEEAPRPEAAAGTVLVRVQAASVNPFDLKLAAGRFRESIPIEFPFPPRACQAMFSSRTHWIVAAASTQ